MALGNSLHSLVGALSGLAADSVPAEVHEALKNAMQKLQVSALLRQVIPPGVWQSLTVLPEQKNRTASLVEALPGVLPSCFGLWRLALLARTEAEGRLLYMSA